MYLRSILNNSYVLENAQYSPDSVQPSQNFVYYYINLYKLLYNLEHNYF